MRRLAGGGRPDRHGDATYVRNEGNVRPRRKRGPMDLRDSLRMMAGDNQWMNEKLYAVCAMISEEDRKRDRKAFFRSIHATLNHLLLTDRAWLGRFNGKPCALRSIDQQLD